MKNLDLLIPDTEPTIDRFTWATVTDTSPVRIRLDGETVPLDITPDCLIDEGWLDLGRRVWCQVYGRRVLIHGQVGKGAYEAPTPIDATPPGVVMEDAGVSPPDGWLACNGAAVSRNGYAALFARINTTYGSGDGSTTFNLPDRQGRVGVGVNPSDAEFNTLGEAGGEKTHLLTEAELAQHDHSMDHDHSMTASYNLAATGSSGSSRPTGFVFGSSGSVVRTGTTGGSSTVNTGNAGTNQAHNNLQPYIAMNYIIKT